MFRTVSACILCLGFSFGITASSGSATAFEPLPMFGASTPQQVYWTFFAPAPAVQVEIATLPLTSNSRPIAILGNSTNMLDEANGLRFDAQGRLWILNQHGGGSTPSYMLIFNPPLTTSKAPLFKLTLAQTSVADFFRFDAAGNLWVSSSRNNRVDEYTGPFSSSKTLTPAKTLSIGISNPSGIALDRSGNLYVSNSASRYENSIAVFRNPIKNAQPYFLDGVTSPGGLIFDKLGNLYGSNNPAPGDRKTEAAIVRYSGSNLKSEAAPNIFDSTGLPDYPSGPYGSDVAFDAAGNLYDADCGSQAKVYVYPTATKPFSSTLAPLAFSDPNISKAGCVWGITIK